MEGMARRGAVRVDIGLIVAGVNPVPVDAVCCRAIGLETETGAVSGRGGKKKALPQLIQLCPGGGQGRFSGG